MHGADLTEPDADAWLAAKPSKMSGGVCDEADEALAVLFRGVRDVTRDRTLPKSSPAKGGEHAVDERR